MEENKQKRGHDVTNFEGQTSDKQHPSGLLETAAHAIGATLGSLAAKTGIVKPVKAVQKRSVKKAAVKRAMSKKMPAKKTPAKKKSGPKKITGKSARKREHSA